jgi:CrcB protein
MIPRGRLGLLVAVAMGGAAGAAARTALERGWAPHDPAAWPWATFTANLAGALLLGVVAALSRKRMRLLGPLVGTGVCGALTTFSTFNLEAIRLARAHADGLAVTYVAASVAGGLLAVAAGFRVAARRVA